ncbi:MAG: alpha-hydroxy-acid oxidizing protein [Aestuariivirga sp.]|nr:alpha-hydroxy-acid oxidizing protein [Aestuariivirga sp.]
MLSPSLARRAYSIDATRDLARQALPRAVFDFADGGAEDERTLRRNEQAFADFDLVPEPLRGAATRDLSTVLFGRTLSMPLMIGPTGLAGLFWPDGERAAMRAAAAAGTAYCLSHGSVCSLEELAAAAGPANRWMQVFVYRDRGFTRELAERAAAANYDALVLTVDNQLIGNRERDIRNGFIIPPRLGPGEVAGMAYRWRWLWRMRRDLPRLTMGNYVKPGDTTGIREIAGNLAARLDPGMSWADVDQLRAQWRGPLVLKGILSPAEAREAVARGIDGVIVSNHGGRQLDGAIASLDALPRIVDATGGRIPVLLDGGIRRGADVVKALALGATACLIARPQLWGLAMAGEAGVAHVLDIFRREIDRTMGLCGLTRVAEITPSLVFRRNMPEHPR